MCLMSSCSQLSWLYCNIMCVVSIISGQHSIFFSHLIIQWYFFGFFLYRGKIKLKKRTFIRLLVFYYYLLNHWIYGRGGTLMFCFTRQSIIYITILFCQLEVEPDYCTSILFYSSHVLCISQPLKGKKKRCHVMLKGKKII